MLLDESSHQLEVTQAVLPRGNGLTRDYESELERFNQKQNTQFAKQTANQSSTIKMQSPENAILLLKADFLRLSADEQKDFIQWAVKKYLSDKVKKRVKIHPLVSNCSIKLKLIAPISNKGATLLFYKSWWAHKFFLPSV